MVVKSAQVDGFARTFYDPQVITGNGSIGSPVHERSEIHSRCVLDLAEIHKQGVLTPLVASTISSVERSRNGLVDRSAVKWDVLVVGIRARPIQGVNQSPR